MKKTSQILLAALLFLTGISAYAVPARRVARTYTQPDGTTVTLTAVGDEFSHYYLTEDGQVVVGAENGYFFAVPDLNGAPMASSVKASNSSMRTEEARTLLAGVSASSMRSAATARRQAKAKTRAAGAQRAAGRAKAASSSNWPSGIGLFPDNTFPVTGSPDVAIILVQFKDTRFALSNPRQYFTDFATKKGFSDSGVSGTSFSSSEYKATGSALDYFTAASNGQFTPNFHVLGPVTLSNNMSYYGGNDVWGEDIRPQEMVKEAAQLLDPTTDFSIFDTDGDGFIDNLYVIYAGLGEANGGSEDTIWPHSYTLYTNASSAVKVDGKILASYACSAEIFDMYGSSFVADGIGTFCHEFSHVMGLPDLYQTEYDQSTEHLTPSDYSIMDYGSYNNNSRTPPTYSIYERNAMGWADIEVLEEGVGKLAELEHMLTSNKGYAIRTADTNEFFLLENRQLSGWDAYIPNHGMLIWHIDYDDNTWNNNAPNNLKKQCVDIVEAGGSADNSSASTMRQYPFPGTKNVTSFTSSTTPALKSWAGKSIDVPLTNIKEANGKITFDVCGGARPDKPVCNYTTSPVVSETPVTITLTRPATVSPAATIKYIYMYNDGSDMVEGDYSAPITIAKSCEFEYWLVDEGIESQITSLKIYIGEEPPLASEYTIVFKDSDAKDTNQISASTYPNYVQEGLEIADCESVYTVMPSTEGLKFGSNKNNGSLTLNINTDYQLEYKQVVLKLKAYGNDATSVQVNELPSQEVTSAKDFLDYTFDLDGGKMTRLEVSSTKRFYIRSITLRTEGTSEPVGPTLQTVATPSFSPKAGEVEKGTAVSISCLTEDATIHYTTDGSTPDATSATFTTAITVDRDMTIKAVAVKDGWNDSEIASAAYTIKTEGGDNPDQPGEDVTDVLTFTSMRLDGSSEYKLYSGIQLTSPAIYSAVCASTNNSIQLRTKNMEEGIVSTVSGGRLKKVAVKWNSQTSTGTYSRKVQIYASNTPFESSEDLYGADAVPVGDPISSADGDGYVIVEGDYAYFGIRSVESALYLDEVAVTWGEASEEPDDPVVPGDELTATFDFTVDDAYGMTINEYNADGHTCTEGHVTATLNGSTRWWNASSGNQLRFYSGSSVTIAAAVGYEITSVKLNDTESSKWDKTTYNQNCDAVTFNTTHTSKYASVTSIDVKYVNTSSAITDIENDNAAKAVYYNLQGNRVQNPGHGIFIRVIGNKATKVKL